MYKWYFNKYSKYNIIDETEDWLYCIEKEDFNVNYKKNFFDSYNVTKPSVINKEIFDNCPFKDKIFKDYQVECVCLSGSFLYGATDNLSDYDLAVFIRDVPDLTHCDKECLFYKGRKLHWYYWSTKELFSNTITYGKNLFLLELYFIAKTKFLYITNQELAHMLLYSGKNIGLINAKKFLKIYKIDITRLSAFTPYQLLCYYILTNQKIDIDLIIAAKRTGHGIDINQYKQKIFSVLLKLKELYADEELLNDR